MIWLRGLGINVLKSPPPLSSSKNWLIASRENTQSYVQQRTADPAVKRGKCLEKNDALNNQPACRINWCWPIFARSGSGSGGNQTKDLYHIVETSVTALKTLCIFEIIYFSMKIRQKAKYAHAPSQTAFERTCFNKCEIFDTVPKNVPLKKFWNYIICRIYISRLTFCGILWEISLRKVYF